MILTLCGSARFENHFKRWNEALTLAGHCVFSLAVYPSDRGGKDWYTPSQKQMLDLVHKAKIDASDGVVLLNADSYIGASTLDEITWAVIKQKRIYALESWGEGCGPASSPFGSPIDTSAFKYICDLLGPTSEFRTVMIHALKTEGVL